MYLVSVGKPPVFTGGFFIVNKLRFFLTLWYASWLSSQIIYWQTQSLRIADGDTCYANPKLLMGL